jgi:hypothetical protein
MNLSAMAMDDGGDQFKSKPLGCKTWRTVARVVWMLRDMAQKKCVFQYPTESETIWDANFMCD